MDIAQIITVTGVAVSTTAAVAAAFYGWKGSRQVHEVHLQLNSRLDELLKASELAGRTQGAADERAHVSRQGLATRLPDMTEG
jgi:hypothetical protein